MKVLITGGCGFIGSDAVRHFTERGHDVIIVDNLSRPGVEHNLAFARRLERTRLIVADLVTLSPAWVDAVRELSDEDAILHLAGQVAVTTSVTDPMFDFKANALATLNLLEAVRKAPSNPALIYSSTNKVYGGRTADRLVAGSTRYTGAAVTEGVSEDAPLDFVSPYGCSKGAADQYVRDYARIYGLRTVVFRQSCIYGPRQFGMEDQGWLAWFVIAALLKQPVTIYGDGKQVRDVLFVEDLSLAYEAAIGRINEVAGQVFNVGGGPRHTVSLLEIVTLLQEQFGLDLDVSFGPARPGDQKAYVSDIRRVSAILGWEPRVSLPDGLDSCYRWCVEHQAAIEAVVRANGSRQSSKVDECA